MVGVAGIEDWLLSIEGYILPLWVLKNITGVLVYIQLLIKKNKNQIW